MRKKEELAKHGFKETVLVDLDRNSKQQLTFEFDPTQIINVKYKNKTTTLTKEILVRNTKIIFVQEAVDLYGVTT